MTAETYLLTWLNRPLILSPWFFFLMKSQLYFVRKELQSPWGRWVSCGPETEVWPQLWACPIVEPVQKFSKSLITRSKWEVALTFTNSLGVWGLNVEVFEGHEAWGRYSLNPPSFDWMLPSLWASYIGIIRVFSFVSTGQNILPKCFFS